jgi:hypothetical protein
VKTRKTILEILLEGRWTDKQLIEKILQIFIRSFPMKFALISMINRY